VLAAVLRHAHGFSVAWGLLIAGVVFVAAIAGLAAVLLARPGPVRRTGQAQRQDLGPMEQEMLAMLRQKGGPLRQPELTDALPADADDIALALRDLERRGLVRREWSHKEQAYLVTPV